ncbi:hypothetical protein BC628DRAFT_148326 [Trametes gibbosa]|nr:hypothetical protein BC628DRAFT_148326 [Trametes gibbosa]
MSRNNSYVTHLYQHPAYAYWISITPSRRRTAFVCKVLGPSVDVHSEADLPLSPVPCSVANQHQNQTFPFKQTSEDCVHGGDDSDRLRRGLQGQWPARQINYPKAAPAPELSAVLRSAQANQAERGGGRTIYGAADCGSGDVPRESGQGITV